MSTDVLITDCDHGDIDIETGIIESAGLTVALAACRTAEEVRDAGTGARALITQYAPVTGETIEALSELRIISRYGTGFDSVDMVAAKARGVEVRTVPDYAVDEVSDHALALTLALTRGVIRADRAIHAGRWELASAGPIRRTGTLTFGVLGLGRIGSRTGVKAAAMGFTVLGSDPVATPEPGPITLVDLPELLRRSDVLSLHAPLTDQTRHIVDAELLAALPAGAVLVNTSRGGLVDNAALARSLADGHLGGAGLDVFEHEPLAGNSLLRSMDNVVLTPHIGFYSQESIRELKSRAAQAVVEVLTSSQ